MTAATIIKFLSVSCTTQKKIMVKKKIVVVAITWAEPGAVKYKLTHACLHTRTPAWMSKGRAY
jgi:hypothetical protein